MRMQFCRFFLGSTGPLAARAVVTIFGCKGAGHLRSPRLRVRQISHTSEVLFPELRARGCFLSPLRRCCLGRNYGFILLADVDGDMIHRMRPDRTEPATPDLSSTDMVRDASPPPTRVATEAGTDRASKRHVLPRDLPKAVEYLTDRELDLLITVSVEEANGGRLLPTSGWPSSTDASVSKQSSSRHKEQAEVTKVSLTRGQVNAVRAALKAGIKPSQIARQFGISQSDVRKVLASDTAKQRYLTIGNDNPSNISVVSGLSFAKVEA